MQYIAVIAVAVLSFLTAIPISHNQPRQHILTDIKNVKTETKNKVSIKTVDIKLAAQTVPVPVPPPPAPPPPPQPPSYPTDPDTIMSDAGISASDFNYVDFIVTHESGWRKYAQEPSSGAYGLCQALPAYKMASAGADWQDNPVTQMRWCNSYALSAYGSWYGAYIHWVNSRWW